MKPRRNRPQTLPPHRGAPFCALRLPAPGGRPCKSVQKPGLWMETLAQVAWNAC